MHNELLIYSLKCEGENKFIKKVYGNNFMQSRMLLPEGKGNIRMIGLSQAKKFHEISKKSIIYKPETLPEEIKKDEILLERILDRVKKGEDIKAIIEDFKEHAFLFFKIFSLGLMLFENQKSVKNKRNISKILKIHDDWRNSVADKEKNILKNLKPGLAKIAKNLNLKNSNDIFYLDISEFEKGIKGGLDKSIRLKINERKNQLCYLNFKGNSWVISSKKEVSGIKDLFKESEESSDAIKGMVAYKSKGRVKGTVVVLNSPKAFKKRSGSILVSLQTTPDFMPIIKNFSAIITDEGGITSHAAIISREFKIPCIVGAKNATQILKDGDLVEVDTNKGLVKILKKAQ